MDFLYTFFVAPFVDLGEGLATATGAADVVSAFDGFFWGPIMIILLLGTHVFMTIRTRFIQRKLPTAIKLSFTKDPDAEGDVSQFGALATALAATIGTGNIVGVATALIAGGPGAILWMWLTGVFGMATKYSEVFIAIKYRVKDHNGNMLGGAMYALERGFKHKKLGKVLGILFALFASIAAFGIGSAVQANSLVGTIKSNFDWGDWANPVTFLGLETTPVQFICAILLVVLVCIVIFGGVKAITRVCEKLVPFMSIFYTLGCIILIFMNFNFIWDATVLIFTCAFTPHAAFGGAVGSGIMLALQKGCARGLFSNESGLGSAPLVASAATTRNPARQALVSMTGTFWDTVVVCLLTGLALVCSMLAMQAVDPTYFSLSADGDFMMGGAVATATDLTAAAFGQLGWVGTAILVIGMVCFTYSTILGWSYYGNRTVTYLFGKHAILPYQVVFVAVAFLGAIGVSGFVWDISDMTNGMMAIPNIIAVLGLSVLIARETKYYVWDKNLDEVAQDDIPVFDAK